MELVDYHFLEQRIGKKSLRRRLDLQIERSAKVYSDVGLTRFHPENSRYLSKSLHFICQGMRLLDRGRKNTLKYKIERVPRVLPNLPSALNGLRILHISDLHADGIADHGARLRHILAQIECDLAVCTGDYRFLTHGNDRQALQGTQYILQSVHAPLGLFGVLGNHDFIEFVPDLERFGLRILFNETVSLEKKNASFYLSGIDDVHLYENQDMTRIVHENGKEHVHILLSHSPEIYKQAESHGIDYMLSGHTHGGQICLPGGIPLITNASCPRRYCSGSWEYKTLHGYTSRGTGSSGVVMRFNCPPEITVHTLLSA
mgnify:CR=1 FL=1